MINTAFTCEVGRVGSHYDIWRPFTAKLIHNLSTRDGGIIYVLFGNQASSFKKYIVNSPKLLRSIIQLILLDRTRKCHTVCLLSLTRNYIDYTVIRLTFIKRLNMVLAKELVDKLKKIEDFDITYESSDKDSGEIYIDYNNIVLS